MKTTSLTLIALLLSTTSVFVETSYPVPDTMQDACYGKAVEIDCSTADEALFGQDAQIESAPTNYTDNGDDTVTA